MGIGASIVVLSGAVVFAIAPKTSLQWNFDAEPADALPKGYASVAGEWKIVADETAPSKGHALAQLAQSEENTFNIVLLDEPVAQNVDINFRFKTISGKIDQGCGAVWRAKDDKNYYLCRYNPLEGNLRIYKVLDGVRTIIHSLEDVEEGTGWQSFRLVCNAKRIEGHLNGEAKFSITDEAIKDAGKVGLWTKADAVTHFDDLEIKVLGR